MSEIEQVRTFSYGGGVQSTAALVLASQGKINFRTFLFANVGEDSEHPKTLEYVHSIAMPFAESQGLELIELHRTRKNGERETILGRITKEGSKSTPIPVFMSTGAPASRSCTVDFKIQVILKYLKKHGVNKKNPAIVGLGISLDEFHRARTNSNIPEEILEYPLIDLRLTRQDCINIISRACLPVPPKSSCYFCPFHSTYEWQRIKREEPELFQKAVELEQHINNGRKERGQNNVWLSKHLLPLNQVIGDQLLLFDDSAFDVCESGYCMT